MAEVERHFCQGGKELHDSCFGVKIAARIEAHLLLNFQAI